MANAKIPNAEVSQKHLATSLSFDIYATHISLIHIIEIVRARPLIGLEIVW